MQARMSNAAQVLPGVHNAVGALYGAMGQGGVPQELLELVHLRVSQVNGCSACVHAASTASRKAGETDDRLFGVAAWRESPFFTDAERAALALAESATRLADRPDAVPDDVWNAAAAHFDDKQLAAIVLMIATANFFNRLNATVKEPAGASWG